MDLGQWKWSGILLCATVLWREGTVRASCSLRDREPSAVTQPVERGHHWPGPHPTGSEQGEQGRPGDGSWGQQRVQIAGQVHGDGTGLRSSQEYKLASQVW